MAAKLKILFVSAEVAPFAKSGGLADVSGSLPIALRRLGHDVRIVMPAYSGIEAAHHNGKWKIKAMPGILHVPVAERLLPAGLLHSVLPGSEVPVYFVAERNLFNRPNIYGYNDDPYRFAFFCRAAMDAILALQWKPDVIHAHDWHGAPSITWLATAGQWDARYRNIASIFTIHNLAYQGRTSTNIFDYLGIHSIPLREEGRGEVNFMARGIYHATIINTVSPTYSREIRTPDGGAGLDGLLRYRHQDLHGILNGLDTDVWNPATDTHLAQNYDRDHLEKRLENKRALQARLGLPVNDRVPLLGMVSRLDRQKGMEIMGHTIHLLMNGLAGDAQFVVLGSGGRSYEEMFSTLAQYHRKKMTAVLTYAADLAPLIYAGSDIFLMPSLFEPCGLSQMIAMRYGSAPVVRETGGLADTVRDGITGFTFDGFTVDDFWNTIQRAMYIYNTDREAWKEMQVQGMQQDFSWRQSAQGYQQLYEWAVARTRP